MFGSVDQPSGLYVTTYYERFVLVRELLYSLRRVKTNFNTSMSVCTSGNAAGLSNPPEEEDLAFKGM